MCDENIKDFLSTVQRLTQNDGFFVPMTIWKLFLTSKSSLGMMASVAYLWAVGDQVSNHCVHPENSKLSNPRILPNLPRIQGSWKADLFFFFLWGRTRFYAQVLMPWIVSPSHIAIPILFREIHKNNEHRLGNAVISGESDLRHRKGQVWGGWLN